MVDPLVVFTVEADAPDPPRLRVLSVRMPRAVWGYLDAMAEEAQLSRNSMAVQLMEWGIGYALAQLPTPIRDDIEAAATTEGED